MLDQRGAPRRYRFDASASHPAKGLASTSGRDVMEQGVVQQRQAQRLEALGRLSAGIAHEINTPIQYIGDNVTFIREAFDDMVALIEAYREAMERTVDIPWEERIQMIARAEAAADMAFLTEEVPQATAETLQGVERVAAIVGAMKTFGHPPSEEKSLANVNELLGSTLIISRGEYKTVADVDTDFAEVPAIRCNAGELNQAFLNLIVNAAHAIADVVAQTGERGRIRVSTARDGDEAVIQITDTGCGMTQEVQARIFDPFFTTKEAGRGTGQGLSLARLIIVEQHRGTITVRSVPQQGTTFEVRLPVTDFS